MRSLALIYSVACYLSTVPAAVWFARFLGNVSSPEPGDRPVSGAAAAIDSMLMVVFGLQHSGMARTGFKK
jgi:methanethiol S-methyltransferase